MKTLPAPPRETLVEVFRLQAAGVGQREIARRLGTTQATVSNWVRRHSPWRCEGCGELMQAEAVLCGFCEEEATVGHA